MTMDDCVGWARDIVRACEDAGYDRRDTTSCAARSALGDIEDLAEAPSSTRCTWTQCVVPTLRGYVDQAKRAGRPERARVYEACIAVRLLAVEVARAALGGGRSQRA